MRTNARADRSIMPIGHPVASQEQPKVLQTLNEGRGGKILALGITALLFLGPILGIPAWIMGRRDLQRIRTGALAESNRTTTQVGMIFGIVGTFISPVFLFVASVVIAITLTVMESGAVQANKSAMMTEAASIAVVARDYRDRPSGAAGGGGSFEGFQLSDELRSTKNGVYMIRVLSSDRLQIIGSSVRNYEDGLIALVNETGSILRWEFAGRFNPLSRYHRRPAEPEEKPQESESKYL